MKTLDAAAQAAITPKKVLELLFEGNQRFLNQEPASRDLLKQVDETKSGQYPVAVIVSCIDSRVPTEILFDQGVGDVFNARIAGNFINEDIAGSLEFACKLAGSKLILIMGHTSCGAVKGACDHAELGNLTQMLDKIKPAVEATKTEEGEVRTSENLDFVNRVSEENVRLSMALLRKMSPILKEMEDAGEIEIAGAMYDVSSGQVTAL